MDSKKLLESINLIREKAENNKLIVFVGAGVSRNVEGMPSWYALVKAMADAIHYSKCNDCKHKDDGCENGCRLREEYSNDEFLKIPQYVYNQNPDLYNQILAEQTQDVSVDAPLSKAIFNINPAHIITTNYDTLLESSTSELREQYQVIVRDKDLLDTTKNKYIIKMHGDLHDISTIVLKEQDYLNYSQDRVLIELFIKSLLTDHTVLFLGYSLNDYNIKQIISWLNYMRSQNNALEGVKVFQEKPFELYLTNDYKGLEDFISKDAYNSISSCFYHSLFSFYDAAIYTAYEGIDFNSLTRSQKTTFLLNKACLDFFKIYTANYQKVKAFIDNTSRKSERECLSFFADMFDGYSSKKTYIEKQFSELKKHYQGNTVSLGGGTLGHFYKIKNIAIELFNFIFYNNIY